MVLSIMPAFAKMLFPAMEDSDWDDVVHTNLDSFYNVRALVYPMIQARQGGRIVTLASVSALLVIAGK